jgi:hypothetical protein
LTFAPERLRHLVIVPERIDELDGNGLAKFFISAGCQEYVSHTTTPDQL